MARSKRRGNANGAGGTSSKTYRLDKKPVAVVMLALSLVIIIYALTYTNFDIIHGRGASAIIFASFAGSGFVLFMAPNTRGGNIKRFVKSYIAAGVLGELGYFALPYLGIYITTALIIPATALVLEGTDSVHAPAISLAFAFIIYDVGLDGIVLVATAMVIL
jgi:hypothetical protein